MSEPFVPDNKPTRPLTDSPWFWLLLFVNAGMVGMAFIAPKYAVREAVMEQKYEARREIARRKLSGEALPAPESTAQSPSSAGGPKIVPLVPLLTILAIVDLLAVIAYFIHHGLAPSSPDEPSKRAQP